MIVEWVAAVGAVLLLVGIATIIALMIIVDIQNHMIWRMKKRHCSIIEVHRDHYWGPLQYNYFCDGYRYGS